MPSNIHGLYDDVLDGSSNAQESIAQNSNPEQSKTQSVKAKSKRKRNVIIELALFTALIAFIKMASAIFSGTVTAPFVFTTLGLSLVAGAIVGDIFCEILDYSSLHLMRDTFTGKRANYAAFFGNDFWSRMREMRQDFKEAFKPYPGDAAQAKTQKTAEWLQPINGLKNIYNGFKRLVCLPFFALVDLGQTIMAARSLRELAAALIVGLIFGLIIHPLAFGMHAATMLIRGLTQVAATPFVYLDKLVREGLTYRRDKKMDAHPVRSEVEPEAGNKIEVKPEARNKIQRRPSIQQQLGIAKQILQSNASIDEKTAQLKAVKDTILDKFEAARARGESSDISPVAMSVHANNRSIEGYTRFFGLMSQDPVFHSEGSSQSSSQGYQLGHRSAE